MKGRLQRLWYRRSFWHVPLLPASWLFGGLVWLRRTLYRLGWLKSVALPVPVVVVGNISVGGTGKTPLVLWLIAFLRRNGFHPGVVSRGYGGAGARPQPVTPDSAPAQVGDEPVLLARRGGCPVWVGRDRVAAAQALLRAHRECDVLLSDDGLQHYRLRRDVEIAVVDGARRFGNGLLLPAGPLREGVRRLDSVDAVVVNLGNDPAERPGPGRGREYSMGLRGRMFYNLAQPKLRLAPEELRGKRLHAVAGIGNPQRFFDFLRDLGLAVTEHAFPDHHPYCPGDLHFAHADAILMTEKDAVKCARFGCGDCWALAVEPEVDPGLGARLLDKMRKRDGPKIA